MKKICQLLGSTLVIMILVTGVAHAQAVTGPSDITTAPPTSATSVNKILCYGTTISLSGPQDVNNVNYATYQWYKMSGSTSNLTTVNNINYTETPTGAGYYNYQLVTENANGCSSPTSGIFQIYVMPQLTPVVTAQSASVCTNSTSSTLLTATVGTSSSQFVLNYQWTRNGVNINGATSGTYNVSGETTAGAVTFAVNVSYALSPTCTSSGTTTITVTPVPTQPVITAN
jgi:hypothetical protein